MTSRPSRFMLGWVGATILVICVATGLGSLAITAFGTLERDQLPLAFLFSTACLVAVSVGLAKAESFAKRERQAKLRRSLAVSLIAALAFLIVQALALEGLVRQIAPDHAATEPTAFLFVAVALHAVHVSAAVLWLIYVCLQGVAGRYDHESRFGLTLCAWCWHALGIVWMAILTVCLTAL